jgi:GNAT superfamily N-acetyltransferase
VNESATPGPVVVLVQSDDDLAAMIEVRAHADPDLPPPRLDNLRRNLAGNARLAYLVAHVADTPVGCGFVDVSYDAATAHVLVVPAARRQGVGTALLAAVSERARASRLMRLQGEIRAIDDESLEFFRRRGFEQVGREEAVVLDLAGTGARGVDPPPPGIRIVSRAELPGVVEGMYEVAREAEPDIPGEDRVRPFDVWRSTEIDRPSLRPELTFVALAGDEVVGYAILDTLGGELWHRLTGVKRAWRGRGIATALKRAQIEAARSSGVARLVTANEERNTAMRSINEALGYRPEPRLSTVVVRGPVFQPADPSCDR